MSIPITCSGCGDLVGIRDGEALLAWGFAAMKGAHDFSSAVDLPCPGKGQHVKPEVRTRRRWFGLVREERRVYPETMTYTEWRRVKRSVSEPAETSDLPHKK